MARGVAPRGVRGRLVRNMLAAAARRAPARGVRRLARGGGAEARRARESEAVLGAQTRAQRRFLRWYWDAFDDDIQVALANILGTAESAMDDAFEPGGLPSAVRGVPPARLAAGTATGGSGPARARVRTRR